MSNKRLQVQDSVLLQKNHFGKACRTLHQEREVTGSGKYFAVLKNITVANQARHYMRNKRSQVEDSILLLKNHFGEAGRTPHQGRVVIG